jgi:hypothetical protein
MDQHFIAWWNVENLFDVEGTLPPDRPEWLASTLRSELEDWDAVVLDKKIAQLAWVIKQMNGGAGPDLLGVGEVENKNVLLKLVDALDSLNRNYQVINHDCGDQRGIDVAFIYDGDKYGYNDEYFNYEVQKRSGTRDLFQANLTTAKGRDFIVIGNHWPSRSGGEYKSAPYRMMAAETLSYWLQRIWEELDNDDVAIFVMGDFNDEPHSRSLTDYALSTMSRNKVVYGYNPYLYNLMWHVLGERRASYVYGGRPQMIDQFLVTKGIAKKSGLFDLDETTVRLEEYPGMVSSRYKGPIRFGRPSSGYNEAGFSDHLPISMVLGEK